MHDTKINDINLGNICIGNEDVLNLEITVNDWRILCMKVVHTTNHAMTNL